MLKVRQVKIDALLDNEENRLKALCKKLKISQDELLSYEISKQSLDARDKNQVFYVYEFVVSLKDEKKILNKAKDVILYEKEDYIYPYSGKKTLKKPVVVGSGPAGLFCAYILAENGYDPIIIEQGQTIEERKKTVEEFWKTGKLQKNSNVQFGEGGAGTFSDGKLNTVVKDLNGRHQKVFSTFVKNGAPKEILYSFKPHIGTDLLTNVIVNIRKEIEKMGGTFLFESKLTDIITENNTLKEIVINNDKHLECDKLVLAIGHSARDTFELLYNKGIKINKLEAIKK